MSKAVKQPTTGVRIDKFLWAARFYKTRKLAQEEIGKNRVKINDTPAKASKEIKVGDTLQILLNGHVRTFTIDAVSGTRGSATIAQTLYTETEDSIKRFTEQKETRRLLHQSMPNHIAKYSGKGRPTKRNRRQMEQTKSDWNSRWSARLDD